MSAPPKEPSADASLLVEPPTLPIEERPGVVQWLIPYRNLYAVSGYYFAIFSLAPLAGLVLGPIAITLGLMGLHHAGREPGQPGLKHAVFSIVVGLLTTVVNVSAAVTCFIIQLFNLLNITAALGL
jgi:hypothetical protein